MAKLRLDSPSTAAANGGSMLGVRTTRHGEVLREDETQAAADEAVAGHHTIAGPATNIVQAGSGLMKGGTLTLVGNNYCKLAQYDRLRCGALRCYSACEQRAPSPV